MIPGATFSIGYTRGQITALFDGLDLVVPGIVDSALWRAEQPVAVPPERSNMIAAVVARRN